MHLTKSLHDLNVIIVDQTASLLTKHHIQPHALVVRLARQHLAFTAAVMCILKQVNRQNHVSKCLTS